MMTFELLRDLPQPDGIFGKLYDADTRLAVTLERNYDGKPKIPAGTYDCVRYTSPRFGFVVWMLTNVPGHDHIEIHPANWQTQLDGCIAVGEDIAESENGRMITHSRAIFTCFMDLTKDEERIQLSIKDATEV